MKPRILIAGGCHVVGYPIGEENSFVNIVRDTLAPHGIATEIRVLSHLPVKHVKRLVETMQSFAPDAVVLQLGNFETNTTFRKWFLQLLGLSPSQGSDAHESLPGSREFRGSWRWRAKCAVKLGLDTILGHPLVNLNAVRQQIAAMFDAVVEQGPAHVLVMSPLPCADTLYLRYRRRLASVFEQEARRRNFQYVKTTDLDAVASQSGWFVDATHLNRRGHEEIARPVANALLSVFAGQAETAAVGKGECVEI